MQVTDEYDDDDNVSLKKQKQREKLEQKLLKENEKRKARKEEEKLEQEDEVIQEAAAKAHGEVYMAQKMVEQKIKKQLQQAAFKQQIELMSGDIEAAKMTQLQTEIALLNAGEILNELDQKEQQIINFRLSQSKQIKCKFCDHKGQSIVEESTSILTYFFLGIYLVCTWQWSGGWVYFLTIVFCILPILAGIFRLQAHSCSSCLNEVKQTSIFNNLDMDDEMANIQVHQFALVIKRRTLLYALVVFTSFLFTCLVFSYELPEAAIVDLGLENFDLKQPDLNLTWNMFYDNFSHRSGGRREKFYYEKFEKEYQFKVIKWSGTVMRVDSYDELDEFDQSVNYYSKTLLKNHEEKVKIKQTNVHNTDNHNIYQDNGDLYQAQIHVKMNPRFAHHPRYYPGEIEEGELNDDPRFQTDLILWFDGTHFDINANVIDELKKGDTIEFTGYIKALQINKNNHRNSDLHEEDALPHIQALKINLGASSQFKF